MSQSNDQGCVIDIAKLKETFMGDIGIVKQILSAFQDAAQSFEEQFKTMECTGDQEQLARLVHGLKGSSANIRATSLASQAANLQHLIDQREDYSAELNQLFASIALLDAEIEKIKAQ